MNPKEVKGGNITFQDSYSSVISKHVNSRIKTEYTAIQVNYPVNDKREKANLRLDCGILIQEVYFPIRGAFRQGCMSGFVPLLILTVNLDTLPVHRSHVSTVTTDKKIGLSLSSINNKKPTGLQISLVYISKSAMNNSGHKLICCY